MRNFLKYTIISYAFLAVLCSGCTQRVMTKTCFAFDTAISVSAYGGCEDAVLEQCLSHCAGYEAIFSRTDEDSQLHHLSDAGDELIELLQIGLSYCERTDGALDLTIGGLSELWNFSSEPPRVPDTAAIATAVSHVDYRNVTVADRHVALSDPDTQLDLGAIAKGYVADRAREFLLEHGVEHAIVDLGGNILCIGGKPDGTPFRVGIRDPFGGATDFVAVVEIKDGSLVTSGVYERYFEQDGIRYHHVLNPKTGFPCDNGLLSVTILSERSVDGDALSTAAFVLGLSDGMTLIDSLPDIYAVFITSDGALHYSQGLLDAYRLTLP